MTLSSSLSEKGRLISLAVYCPLLCQDREEKAQDNILFYSPPHTSLNRQMNHVGFCIAMSSLAARFGVQHSNRQTIRKQSSNVCLCSPVVNLFASAHVRGGYAEAETTHQLLQLCFALFELLYGRAMLHWLTELPRSGAETVEASADGDASSSATVHTEDVLEARVRLQSFFTKCAVFISDVLAAQQRVLTGGAAASFRPSPSMTSTQWAQYLSNEATLGFPLHYVSARELPRCQLSDVEDAVQRVLWTRARAQADSSHEPGELPRCCVFCLPSLYVLIADSRLPCRVLQAIKLYLVLYAPISSSSFMCHLPEECPSDVAVWIESDVLVVLIEAQRPQHHSAYVESTSPDGSSSGVANEAAALSSSLPLSQPASLLDCASAIGSDVRQLLVRAATGLTTSTERDAYWLSMRDVALHEAQYTAATPPKTIVASTSALVVHLRLVGRGVVEGTSLMKMWPGLVEHLRTIIHSARLIVAATPSANAAWECWTRWASIQVYLRLAGPTVTVLAWRPPVNVRQLSVDAKRILLLGP